MTIIIDAKYFEMAKKLWGKKHKIYPSFCHENLPEQISTHPDMTLTPVGDIFVCCPESLDYYKNILGERVISGETELSFHYPNDIAYNVLIYKNKAFGKTKSIDGVLKTELQKRNIDLVDINQGYAKCSSAICKEGVITADESVYNALVKNNINTLKITPGYIDLPGYDCGFIGGASGLVDGKLTFFGDVSKHPDFCKIKSFCDFNYFKNFPLIDVGTIFCI